MCTFCKVSHPYIGVQVCRPVYVCYLLFVVVSIGDRLNNSSRFIVSKCIFSMFSKWDFFQLIKTRVHGWATLVIRVLCVWQHPTQTVFGLAPVECASMDFALNTTAPWVQQQLLPAYAGFLSWQSSAKQSTIALESIDDSMCSQVQLLCAVLTTNNVR